ncbi:MAG: hypothetical protein B6U94_02125 [Thermofilum sp. ex4484_79]|nr:MAG: hypothetical protein B6U94_02125 [Thermofilum sp. ex4484_79]
MDRYGIRKGYYSAISSLLYDYREGNKLILDATRKYPERINGLVSVNPYFGDEAIAELKKYVLEYSFKGVKFHPSYFYIEPSHNLAMPIWETMTELDVVLMIHTYDGGVEVYKVAKKFPDLIIIAYHMGGTLWKEAVDRLSEFGNVYFEMSSSIADPGMIRYAVEKAGVERILFGSDIPFNDPAVSLGKVLDANLSLNDYEKIFYRNAERLLGE